MAITAATALRPAPVFTVVMPCYHAQRTIAAAIGSVLAQDEPDFELIIVDDGSTDDSVAVARAAIGDDPRGRVVSQPNAGPSAARNTGAAMARGEFLAFLDADDGWSPDTLSAHRAHFARRADLGVSFGRTRFYDTELSVPGRCSPHVADLDLGDVLAENPLCTTSNLVVRRALFNDIGGFDTTLTHAEDQEFVVHILATTAWKVCGIDAELVKYRTSPIGLSSDLTKMEQGWNLMLDHARRYAEPTRFAAAEAKGRALYGRYLARRALRTGHSGRVALAYFAAGLRSNPGALFAAETRRTLMTAIGILAALILPRRLIAPLIAR